MRLLPFALALTATTAAAQPPASAAPAGLDSSQAASFARARRLVSGGNGALGRALVDTVLAAATPGTPAYAEALYWRATLAERSADAERDYRQLAVEYAGSPRGADALIRLAQLDLVRSDPSAARDHLGRLLRDHTDRPSQARAHYWLARAALDANDPRGACDALNAAAGVSEPGGDLARQVVALRARVPRCTLTVSVGAATASPATTPAATAPPVAPPVASDAVGRFTVQVAAYDTRADAAALAARLAARGLDARVEAGGRLPDTAPFRVRIGRYATRTEAATAQRTLKAKGLAGFIATSSTRQ